MVGITSNKGRLRRRLRRALFWQTRQRSVLLIGLTVSGLGLAQVCISRSRLAGRFATGDHIGITSSKSLLRKTCPTYGCALYPLEIDDAAIVAALQTEKNDPQSPRGESTLPPLASHDFAMVTRQSKTHAYNQDRAFFFRNFTTNQSPPGLPTFLIGLLDGHGTEGHRVAAYATMAIPARLAEKLNARPCCQSEQWIRSQLVDAFVEIDHEAPPNALRGGCTASISLRIGHKLFVANTGDSQILVMHRLNEEDVNIAYRTRKDKAYLPEEKSRIEGMGGQIHIPPAFPEGSRVIVRSVSVHPPETIGLAMSRSIGDWEWGSVGVIPDPIVDVVDLTALAGSAFVVAASDGLWDLRKPEFYAKLLSRAMFDDDGAVFPSRPLSALVEAIYKAAPEAAKWYRDDMTAVVVRI
ncbi:predicted protein [Phaeodactylum tricornutum CCAP 1055/1]|jgi:serine/threonine protein phosphatase PrpC|uniref:PPM-type phosphatase domain-containing protein n=2 Tax=Phaeodactylum tricornutum TaxID=2850 RepID=B7G7C0_PHATC|nr:predicted protein [Phaeodactylum tricornutum CCAP 1055/1]EEC45740.1 predicted protein [Phaeodactylum tricornutum CCAP 1055/1]|eukprot:XP_002183004.1 predicted protein [Phaeodactylum tricornutum CCAP 1055/1]